VAPHRVEPRADPVATPRRGRVWIWAVVAVVLLAAAAGLIRWLVMQQYFVAEYGAGSESTVAVYQGIQGAVLGLKLNDLYETSDLRTDDLQEDARAQVQEGVRSEGLQDARDTVARLRTKLLPECPKPVPTPAAQIDPATGRPVESATPAPNEPTPLESNSPCRTVG